MTDRTAIRGTTAGEISGSVRDLVGAGRLRPGDPVPPIRELAAELGVHRNTVAAAYRMLVGAGVAETRGRHGTVITALPQLPGEAEAHRGLVDLSSGNPDPALLPDVPAALSRLGYRMQMYGSAAVEPRLAQWARRTWTGEVDVPFEVSVTHGAVDAVERLLLAHLTRGDLVAMEDPCFYASEGTLRLNGFRAAPVPVDAAGMEPAALHAALVAGARAVLITPRVHSPTGVSLTADRAAELRAVLARHPHVLVLEDDHFSAISRTPYHRTTPPTARRWALVRSVAKFLGPDLRVAVVASDVDTANRLGTRLRPGATWVSRLLQQLAAELLETSADTFTRARDAYRGRVDTLRAELAAGGVETPFPTNGFNVWVPIPEGPAATVAALHESGWSVRDGALFLPPGSTATPGLRITAARLTPPQTREFARCLGELRRSPPNHPPHTPALP
ncbi:aminotransferase class I/II-fold pyridoxal phosphate-dependent enzyme [Amycolatopsis panacis]|uniref:Aminotransferase class I/II-fold pyridoxal phosphate-dependent enzyme n=1 Tax=Amycolatopsis panacis TaxID=2340917 RepID=A0A419I3R4_9PSEU|nr:aminotransferase class I/II-fold pyridoxal phosphate-dependent enzyme [Amycolatopsis panacis]RJQ84853.1 aminotransferase class I/II-fold pyridoxal phosphate-dependent enzyme [Amycolatopsis panacis]